MKHLHWLLISVITLIALALGLHVDSESVQAKSLNYQALTYGTTKTSIASGYFVHPASVKVKNHKYVVTMRIRTAKKLTSYPVTVTSVNGGKPKNIRKNKDAKGNSNYYYTFTTTNLKKKINAKLKINVPKVYKATHLITFKFSTTGLPSLGKKAEATTAVSTSQASATSSSGSQKAATKAASSSPKAASSASSKQKTKVNSNSSSSQSSSVASTPEPRNQTANHQTRKTADSPDKSKAGINLPLLIGGVLAIIVVVGGTSLWLLNRK